MRVCFLGSGSSGNAAVVGCGATNILVDCGFSMRETVRRLGIVGIDPEDLDVVLLTHSHSDHVRGARPFASRFRIPLLASEGTAEEVGLGKPNLFDQDRVRPGRAFTFGEIDIIPFSTSHDTSDPVGYRFESAEGSLCLLTDCGALSREMVEMMDGCEFVGIETNHDTEMLEKGPYPWFLKRRILSDRGHLSNESAADAVADLDHGRLKHVFALHLSSTNNLPALASAALERVLSGSGVGLSVVTQETPAAFGG